MLPIVKTIESIPTQWPSADAATKQSIISSLNLVAQLGTITTTLSLQTEKSVAVLFLQVLEQLCTKLASIPITSNSQRREFDKLLFKSRILLVANQVTLTFGLDTIINYDMLVSQWKDLDQPYYYIGTILSLDPTSFLKMATATSTAWGALITNYHQLSTAVKQRVVVAILRYANKNPNPSAWCRLLQSLLAQLDIASCATVIELAANNQWKDALGMCTVGVQFVQPQMLTTLLAQWLATSFLATQRVHTAFMVYLAYKLPSDQVAELMKTSEFIDGISAHLSLLSLSVKALAIAFANKLSEISNQAKIFNMAGDEDIEGLKPVAITPMELEEVITSLQSIGGADADSMEVETVAPQPLSLELTNQSTTQAKPRFIKDLLDYLRIDKSKHDAYEMARAALEVGPTLVRQKPKQEVALYASELYKDVVGLGNQWNDGDFVQWCLSLLIAILVKCPEVVADAVKLVATGDYSLLQRMQILTSCSMACRELRGFDDETVTSSFTKKTFASEKLPLAIDKLYQQQALEDVQGLVLSERSQAARDQVADSAFGGAGKVVRVLKRLLNQRQLKDQPKNTFSQVSNREFFFPLVGLWSLVGERVDIGHYTGIFVGHYFTTLTLVVLCGFPSHDYNEAVREWMSVATLVAGSGSQDPPVLQAVATGVLVVIDSIDEDVLVAAVGQELTTISVWLMAAFEKIVDDKTRLVVAGALMAINEINKLFENTLANQLNGFY